MKPDPLTFWLNDPEGLFNKLQWEFHQLTEAMSPENNAFPKSIANVYGAYNCAITAWHLADWVWQSANGEQKALLRASMSFSAKRNAREDLEGFCEAMCTRWPEMRACRAIANGSKHLNLSKHPHDVAAEVDWGNTAGGHFDIVMHVRYGSRSVPVVEFFAAILDIWRTLLDSLGMRPTARYVQDLASAASR